MRDERKMREEGEERENRRGMRENRKRTKENTKQRKRR